MDKNNIPTHYIPTGSVLKGRYRIDGYLGEGGFGITYKGTNTVLDLPVAIKEYFPGGYANRYAPSGLKVTLTDQRKGLTFNQWKDKFLAEARTLAKFSKDPGIVSVYDYFEENDTAYIVMEYLEGITLKEYVSTRGVFSPDDLCGKMLPLLDSLRDVHEENLIHRDISPDNIMLLKDGTFKLFDFGAAREFDSDGERSMSIILRPGYAPEEQYRSHGKQGPFTDVYAICGVMYFCLTGLTPEESTERVYQDELKPLSEFDGIPEHIASAVMKGLAIRSSDRFQTISELISALGGKEITPETNIPREHERPAEDHSSGTVMLERSAGANTTGDRTEFIFTGPDSQEKERTQYIWGDNNPSGNGKTSGEDESERTVAVHETDTREPEPQKKKSSKLPIIISASAAAVVGVVALIWVIAASGSQESIEVSADTPDVTTVAATTTATKATTESRNTVAVTSAAPETGADDVTWVDYMSYVDFLGNVGKYHGDVKNGFPHGLGQFKYNSEDSVVEYNGNWENGFRCGQGKETISYRNGNSFIGEGTFSNDQLNGEAVWTQNYTDQPGIESQTWKGTCINDIFNGAGTITTVYSSGDIKVDEGEFTDDILNGKGTTTYHYADGTGEILSGEFKNGELVNYTTTPIENTAVESIDAKDTVLNIYAWNEEFKGFFEKYMPGYDNSAGTLDGVKVNWTIVPSYDLAYQNSLDRALMNNASASKENKVDLFLAEADYILKYTDSDYTLDISTIGLKQVDTEYQYTVDAATDSNGRIKGVSFQCCPSALIYRRSIAKAVLGTDDPDQVQAKLDSWDKFDAVAAQADKLGYYMTPSFAETYRVFSNNTNSPWVTNGELAIPNSIKKWINQAATYVKNYYTLPVGIWDSEKTDQMFKNGKTMCFFGPAWYFNFCMGNAYDPEYGSIGDWAICKGPQAHFWGGTWLLAASGTDNPALVAKVMRAFTENEEVCEKLIRNEAQFTNNSKVNERFASDPNYGNAFLGGQNDVAVFAALSDDIVWKNATVYDQACNERLQEAMRYCFDGYYGTDGILPKFYELIKSDYPSLKTP